MLPDMPKLECPFVRKLVKFDEYLVTPEINPWYEWVFEDENVKCVEKMDGTNISIKIQDKKVIAIQNRLNIIDPWDKSTAHIMEWLYESLKKGYLDLPDGVYFGELIGPKLQWNPYKLERHVWIPFLSYAQESLAYKSWEKQEKTFENISIWFRDHIFSLYHRKIHDGEITKPEWVIFIHPDGRMAKLRLDMFDWWEGRRHKGEGLGK